MTVQKHEMRIISRIDVVSFTKLYGCFGFLIGLITGILNYVAFQSGTLAAAEGTNFFVLFLLNVLVYTVLIYLGALLFVLFYNKMAKAGKGIKVELK